MVRDLCSKRTAADKIMNKMNELMENHLGIIIQLMIESYDPVKKVFRDYIQIILTYI